MNSDNFYIEKTSQKRVEGKEVLNLSQAAQFLSLSKSYLYKLTSSNVIPFYKPRGKMIYFRRSELVDWMLRGRNQTLEEVKEDANRYCNSSTSLMD